MPGLQFYLELKDSKPKVWRRVVVPIDYTFYKFHLVIQGAFGWENYHLFQFSETGFLDKICYTELTDDSEEDDGFTAKDARRTKIKLVFAKEQTKFTYIYDFGDSWSHHILYEKLVKEEIGRPYCMEGGGACPPEDCGSLSGYAALVNSLNNPRDPERKSYIEWLGLKRGERWDVNFFSTKEANKRLCLLE